MSELAKAISERIIREMQRKRLSLYDLEAIIDDEIYLMSPHREGTEGRAYKFVMEQFKRLPKHRLKASHFINIGWLDSRISKKEIQNALTYLARTGKIVRVVRGVYEEA